MKKIQILLFVFMASSLSIAQQKDIEVIQKKLNNDVVISIKNNTSSRQKISFFVNGSGFNKINSPIIKLVNKGETVEFATIKPKPNQSYTFNTNYTYEPEPKQEDMSLSNKQLEGKLLNEKDVLPKLNEQLEGKLLSEKDDFSKGLYIFTIVDCPRSQRTLSYVLANNVEFKYAPTDKKPELNSLMWKKLNSKGVKKDITMPVVIHNGKITHSHKDLNTFLKTLK